MLIQLTSINPIKKWFLHNVSLEDITLICLLNSHFNKSSIINKGYKLNKSKGFSDTSVGRYSLALYELAELENLQRFIFKHTI